MLEAMQASSDSALAFLARRSTSTWTFGEIVAQLMNTFPAAFASTYPVLEKLNIMRLASPASAIFSAVIFNALIIVLLIPLAMTLMRAKGLTENDFASNHPAGQLGKRLTLRVSDLMHGGKENPTIGADAAWMEIVSAITHYGLGAVNVVDSEGRLAGIITDGDLRRSMQRVRTADLAFANLKCDDLMTRNPVVANPEMLAFDALRLMEDRPSQINVLPVVDDNRLCVGLIRLHDIVRSGL